MAGKAEAFFALILFLVFSGAVLTSRSWPADVRTFPLVAGLVGLLASLGQFGIDLLRSKTPWRPEDSGGIVDVTTEYNLPTPILIQRVLRAFAWIFGFFALIWLVGFLLAIPVFLALYLHLEAKEKWWFTLIYLSVLTGLVVAIFDWIFHFPWPVAAIQTWLGL